MVIATQPPVKSRILKFDSKFENRIKERIIHLETRKCTVEEVNNSRTHHLTGCDGKRFEPPAAQPPLPAPQTKASEESVGSRASVGRHLIPIARPPIPSLIRSSPFCRSCLRFCSTVTSPVSRQMKSHVFSCPVGLDPLTLL